MKPDIADLLDDVRLSKHDIASLLEVVEKKYEEKIHYLEERIRLLQGELYGRKSEKRYPEDSRQLPIFDQDRDDQGLLQPAIDDTIVVPAHRRGKRGRKPLPDNLPRVDVIHDLAEEEKVCACGAPLSRIGQDTCEKLDYVPAKVRVLRHIRYKYACKSCEDGPITNWGRILIFNYSNNKLGSHLNF
jgi:transposase